MLTPVMNPMLTCLQAGACRYRMLRINSRPTNGCMTGSPGTERDVPRRDVVGCPSEGALTTEESSLTDPVGLIDVGKLRARSAGATRIDSHARHPGRESLVLQKGPELEKRPVRVSRPLLPTNRGPVTNTAEVFDSDPAPGVFGDGDDTLRD